MSQDFYENCMLCPNRCKVNRNKNQVGRCGETSHPRVAWAGLHRGEEPPVSGKNGSGMVFFSGCSLQCNFCQNYQISHEKAYGKRVTTEELVEIFLKLQEMGAKSLNLVTGTHFIPSIISSLSKAKEKGLCLPVVWNSSGYEEVDILENLDSFIDLYLLDAKTIDYGVSEKFCGLRNYPEKIIPVLNFLKKKHPVTDVDNLKGVLIRHLVFPETTDKTVEFLHFFADHFKNNFCLSLMVQFVSPFKEVKFKSLTKKDYQLLISLFDKLEIDGFIQKQSKNEESWLPDFTKENPFPKEYAVPLLF